ncbi:MAG: hypothetical protein LUH14_06940 [Clostridiaceae bacterium]|nr:hypothetical protein [Clostridiaceae bacterium]
MLDFSGIVGKAAGGLIGNMITSAMGIKTVKVDADQLAEIINLAFLEPASSMDFVQRVENTVAGSKLTVKELYSEDGKYYLYVSLFERGLTQHRTAFVKDLEQNTVYEWSGYNLSPLKNAVAFKIAARSMKPFEPVVTHLTRALEKDKPKTEASRELSGEKGQPASEPGQKPASKSPVLEAGNGQPQKALVTCKHCGAFNASDALFCGNCGTELQPVPTQTKSEQEPKQEFEPKQELEQKQEPEQELEQKRESEQELEQALTTTYALVERCAQYLGSKGVISEAPSAEQAFLENIEKIKSSNQLLAGKLKRGLIALEDQEWEDAELHFNNALDMEPECSEAYIGKLLTRKRMRYLRELCRNPIGLKEDKDFQRAIRYAGENRSYYEGLADDAVCIELVRTALEQMDCEANELQVWLQHIPDEWYAKDARLHEMKEKNEQKLHEEKAAKEEREKVLICSYCGAYHVGAGCFCKECGRKLE